MKGPSFLRVSFKNLLLENDRKDGRAIGWKRDGDWDLRESVVWMRVSSVPLSPPTALVQYSTIQFSFKNWNTSSQSHSQLRHLDNSIYYIDRRRDDEGPPNLLLQTLFAWFETQQLPPPCKRTWNPAARPASKSKSDWDPKAFPSHPSGSPSRRNTFRELNNSLFSPSTAQFSIRKRLEKTGQFTVPLNKRWCVYATSSPRKTNCNRRENVVRRTNWMFVFNRLQNGIYLRSGRWALFFRPLHNSWGDCTSKGRWFHWKTLLYGK